MRLVKLRVNLENRVLGDPLDHLENVALLELLASGGFLVPPENKDLAAEMVSQGPLEIQDRMDQMERQDRKEIKAPQVPKVHRVLLVSLGWLVRQDSKEIRDHKGTRGTRETKVFPEKGVSLVIQEDLVPMAILVKLDW